MAAPNRAALIGRLTKVLKKHYKPTKGASRSVMDTLIFASCLENAHPESADTAYQNLQQVSFDLNELRVTTVAELAELLRGHPHPGFAANNLKQLLQSVFESQYSFDLEHLRKQKLGQAIAQIQKYKGSTPFIVAYVTQNALGGHAIPIDRGTLECLYVVGIIDEKEREKHLVPGLDRAIPKNRGIEFASLLHQLGAEMSARPFGPTIRNVLLEINPEGKDRLPKRSSKKKTAEEVPVEPPPTAVGKSPKSAPSKTAQESVAPRKKGGSPAADHTARPAAKSAKKSPPKKPKAAKTAQVRPPSKTGKKPVKPTKKPTKAAKTITRRKPK